MSRIPFRPEFGGFGGSGGAASAAGGLGAADAIGLALGAATFGLGVASGFSANRQAQRVAGSIADAARVRLQQESDSAATQLANETRRTAQVVGTIRAIAGQRGAGLTGGDRATLLASTLDAARNRSIIRRNLNARGAAISSQAAAQIAQVRAATQSPFEVVFGSALQAAGVSAPFFGGSGP